MTPLHDTNKIRFRALWALRTIVWLLCGSIPLALAQTQNSDTVAAQSDTPVLRVHSRLVVVRVMVADKRAWHNGPSEAGKRCALAAQEKLLRLPATEPYLPPDCEGVYIRGLTAKDFHLLVDGKEQRIESVTSESDGIRVRDNLGLHNEYSQTPAGKWSTTDSSIANMTRDNADYGLLARNRYDVSFVPQSSNSAGCHKIKVKVDRRKTIVAARDEYCASESPSDILPGSTLGNQLERDLNSGQRGEIPLALQAEAFESEKGNDRVRITLEFPRDLLYRQWSQDWIEHATIGVLGLISRQDGTVASRFSDFACCMPYSTGTEFGAGLMTMDSLNQLTKQLGFGSNVASKIVAGVERGTLPTRYETDVDLPPGEYALQIVLSDGKKFGRAESHLKVDSFVGKELGLSNVMLSNRFRDAHVAEVESKFANFAPQCIPMVSKGVQVTPDGNATFSPNENLIAYFEIYAPQRAIGSEPGIQAHARIVEAKSGNAVKDFSAFDIASYEQPGKAVVHIAREIPLDNLSNGEYRLEVQASDASGRTTPWRAASFAIIDTTTYQN